MPSPLVVIVGPTASGKSALAMTVARKYDGEIICADSRTVYKGMDIGTAKPSRQDQLKVPHHLLDVVEPNKKFTAVDFKQLATQAIKGIASRGHLPVMVGGTGLYVDSVVFNYTFGEPADPEKRAMLLQKSIEELQKICREQNIDIPANAQNKRHLIRAIELGGLPHLKRVMRPNTLVVGIATDREELRKRVIARAKQMVQEGITEEVRMLGDRYGWDNEAMTGNIYRIFRGVVEGTKSIEDAIEDSVRSDMSLAKRQITWFKRNPYIKWGTAPELMTAIDDFIRVVKR